MRPKRVILVVDDDEVALSVRCFVLEQHQYRVHRAQSAAEAVRVYTEAQAGPNRVDVVLTDFHMPEMDGVALAEQIKAINPETPVLIITGAFYDPKKKALTDRPSMEAEKLLPGNGVCDGWLTKGNTVSDLLDRIIRATARKRGPKPQPKLQPAAELVTA